MRFDLRERDAGWHGGGQIAGAVLDDAVDFMPRVPRTPRCARRVAPTCQLRPRAADDTGCRSGSRGAGSPPLRPPLVRFEDGGINIARPGLRARRDAGDTGQALHHTARRRKHLAGIADAGRIERAAHQLHRVEIGRRKHLRHRRRLVGADAVLARDRPAGLDAVRQDLRGDLFRELALPGNSLVVADERMKIAVAGVKHVADAQPRALFERRECGASTSGSFVRGITPSCT